MTTTLPDVRYERKFVADGFALSEVLVNVRRHPAAFREAYPERVVNNVYLDLPSRRDYHEHVNGTANRSKTRVRWYGPEWEAAEGHTLERKLKRGLVGCKDSYRLSVLSIYEGSLRSQLDAAFTAARLPEAVRSGLRHQEPALLNRYRRHYFLSRDKRFRLTVDSGLQFAPAFSGHPSRLGALPPMSSLILELKYGPEVAGEAHNLTQSFSFRVTRFSKYVAGIQLIGGA